MAKPPHTSGEMGVLYLICWRRNYPQDRGTRPELGVSVIASLAHIAHGMGDIINSRACQSLRIQDVDGFVQIAARIFEVRCWAAHHGDEAPKQVSEGVARPGRGHRHRETPPLWQARGRLSEVVLG